MKFFTSILAPRLIFCWLALLSRSTLLQGVAETKGLDAKDYPFFVRIEFEYSTNRNERTIKRCGGTIWDAERIVTAARCLYNEASEKQWVDASLLKVFASDNIQLNVLSYKSFGDPEQRIPPPGDDIAVLRLHWSSPVKHPNPLEVCSKDWSFSARFKMVGIGVGRDDELTLQTFMRCPDSPFQLPSEIEMPTEKGWSKCSQVCGGGSQTLKYCPNYVESCIHLTRVCNTRSCGKDEGWWNEKCRELKKINKPTDKRWFAAVSVVKGCKVGCHSEGFLGYAPFNDTNLPDGTVCDDTDQQSVCLSGECKSIGCDGLLESKKRYDACGVCNGDGSSCPTKRSVTLGGPVFFYDSLTKKAVCHYGVDLKGDVLHCNKKIKPGTIAVMTDFLNVYEQDPTFSVNTTRFIVTQTTTEPKEKNTIKTKNYPFMVQLEYKLGVTVQCGATVWDEKTAVTAANCLYNSKEDPKWVNASQITIYSGSFDRTSDAQVHKVQQYQHFQHPTKGNDHSVKDDIVLLLLSEDTPFTIPTKTLQPCKEQQLLPFNEHFQLRGYGFGKKATNSVNEFLRCPNGPPARDPDAEEDWGYCSQPCGGGLQTKLKCTESETACEKTTRVCNAVTCEEGEGWLNGVCEAKRKVHKQSDIRWTPDFSEAESCVVACTSENSGVTHKFEDISWLDGALCNWEKTKICLSGNCTSIHGCDGVLNSGKKPDDCGQCGGSCQKMKSVMMGGPVVYFDADQNEAVCLYAVGLKGKKVHDCDGMSNPGTLALIYDFERKMNEHNFTVPETGPSSTKNPSDYFGDGNIHKEDDNEEEEDRKEEEGANQEQNEGEELERSSTSFHFDYSGDDEFHEGEEETMSTDKAGSSDETYIPENTDFPATTGASELSKKSVTSSQRSGEEELTPSTTEQVSTYQASDPRDEEATSSNAEGTRFISPLRTMNFSTSLKVETTVEVPTGDNIQTVNEQTNVSATQPTFESLFQSENIKQSLKPFQLFKQYILFFVCTSELTLLKT